MLGKVIAMAINDIQLKIAWDINKESHIFMTRWKNKSIREHEYATIPSFLSFFSEISIEMISSIVVDIVFPTADRFPADSRL